MGKKKIESEIEDMIDESEDIEASAEESTGFDPSKK